MTTRRRPRFRPRRRGPRTAARPRCVRRPRSCPRRWPRRQGGGRAAATPTASRWTAPSTRTPGGRRARAPCGPGAASRRSNRDADTCPSRSPRPTAGRPAGRLARRCPFRGRDRPARGRGQLAAPGARAGAGAARAAGGDGAAAVARAAAHVPAQAQPRTAHPAHRDPRLRDQPAAPDVTWDAESQQRFLSRIATESARLGRLVNDLLDFSAIESGILRLQQRLVRHPAGRRRRGRRAAAGRRVPGHGRGREPGFRPSGPTTTGWSRCSST